MHTFPKGILVREDDDELFMEKFRQCGLIKIMAVGSKVERPNEDMRASLLVHLLPKLEELSIGTDQVLAMGLFNHFSETQIDRPLLSSKLRMWERSEGTYNASPCSVFKLAGVMLCPSIKTIKARFISPHKQLDDGNWPSDYGQSNVDTIEWSGGWIQTQYFADILKLPRSLKKFVYKEGKISSTLWNTSPRIGIAQALALTAATLQVLDINLTGGQRVEWPKGDQSVYSLCTLKALNTLGIQFLTLVDYKRLYRPDGSLPSIRLVDLLPPGLETFTVYSNFQYATAPEDAYFGPLEQILLDQSDIFLPRLRRVVWTSGRSLKLPDRLIQLGHSQSVSISCIKLD
jgi:hypothetical protein